MGCPAKRSERHREENVRCTVYIPRFLVRKLLQGFEAEISATDASYGKMMKEDLPTLNHALEQASVVVTE